MTKRRPPTPTIMRMVLRAIARAPVENWADEDLRLLIGEMQYGARLALSEVRVR